MGAAAGDGIHNGVRICICIGIGARLGLATRIRGNVRIALFLRIAIGGGALGVAYGGIGAAAVRIAALRRVDRVLIFEGLGGPPRRGLDGDGVKPSDNVRRRVARQLGIAQSLHILQLEGDRFPLGGPEESHHEVAVRIKPAGRFPVVQWDEIPSGDDHVHGRVLHLLCRLDCGNRGNGNRNPVLTPDEQDCQKAKPARCRRANRPSPSLQNRAFLMVGAGVNL